MPPISLQTLLGIENPAELYPPGKTIHDLLNMPIAFEKDSTLFMNETSHSRATTDVTKRKDGIITPVDQRLHGVAFIPVSFMRNAIDQLKANGVPKAFFETKIDPTDPTDVSWARSVDVRLTGERLDPAVYCEMDIHSHIDDRLLRPAAQVMNDIEIAAANSTKTLPFRKKRQGPFRVTSFTGPLTQVPPDRVLRDRLNLIRVAAELKTLAVFRLSQLDEITAGFKGMLEVLGAESGIVPFHLADDGLGSSAAKFDRVLAQIFRQMFTLQLTYGMISCFVSTIFCIRKVINGQNILFISEVFDLHQGSRKNPHAAKIEDGPMMWFLAFYALAVGWTNVPLPTLSPALDLFERSWRSDDPNQVQAALKATFHSATDAISGLDTRFLNGQRLRKVLLDMNIIVEDNHPTPKQKKVAQPRGTAVGLKENFKVKTRKAGQQDP